MRVFLVFYVIRHSFDGISKTNVCVCLLNRAFMVSHRHHNQSTDPCTMQACTDTHVQHNLCIVFKHVHLQEHVQTMHTHTISRAKALLCTSFLTCESAAELLYNSGPDVLKTEMEGRKRRGNYTITVRICKGKRIFKNLRFGRLKVEFHCPQCQ